MIMVHLPFSNLPSKAAHADMVHICKIILTGCNYVDFLPERVHLCKIGD